MVPLVACYDWTLREGGECRDGGGGGPEESVMSIPKLAGPHSGYSPQASVHPRLPGRVHSGQEVMSGLGAGLGQGAGL